MDIRYKKIEQWDDPASDNYRDPNYEHYRIQRMMEDHEKWSIRVFWGMVTFWVILGLHTLVWLYTYVYTPISNFVSAL